MEPEEWRKYLRLALYMDREGRSDLTGRPLYDGFHLHEGLFERRWVPKKHWQYWLFAGPNCFLLRPDEHIPNPPDRVECYKISCRRYGKGVVDRWIESLPFKVSPSMPWKEKET